MANRACPPTADGSGQGRYDPDAVSSRRIATTSASSSRRSREVVGQGCRASETARPMRSPDWRRNAYRGDGTRRARGRAGEPGSFCAAASAHCRRRDALRRWTVDQLAALGFHCHSWEEAEQVARWLIGRNDDYGRGR